MAAQRGAARLPHLAPCPCCVAPRRPWPLASRGIVSCPAQVMPASAADVHLEWHAPLASRRRRPAVSRQPRLIHAELCLGHQQRGAGRQRQSEQHEERKPGCWPLFCLSGRGACKRCLRPLQPAHACLLGCLSPAGLRPLLALDLHRCLASQRPAAPPHPSSHAPPPLARPPAAGARLADGHWLGRADSAGRCHCPARQALGPAVVPRAQVRGVAGMAPARLGPMHAPRH